ncbi:long-chain fatty acid--CoA ligase, partial [Rhizobium leguminosarum]
FSNSLTIPGMSRGLAIRILWAPSDMPVNEFEKSKVHIFPGLNTLFNALMNNADFAKLDLSSLIMSLGGGMAVQRPVADRWLKMT